MNNKIHHIIKSELNTTVKTFAAMGIKINIQVYLLTEYEGKKALTKNPLFRAQGDDSLPSSPKKYDFLDAERPLQIALAFNETATKYRHIDNEERHPKQGFVVASPIVSDIHGLIGSLCFAGSIDPVLNKLISFEDFKSISESLAKTTSSTLDLVSNEELVEISR